MTNLSIAHDSSPTDSERPDTPEHSTRSTTAPRASNRRSPPLVIRSTSTTSAASSATWLTVTSPGSGSGSATVSYAAAANAGAQRSANLNVGGATFVVTQAAPATAALSATAISFSRQTVGTTSAVKSVTLKNSGGGTLQVSALNAGGANPGDFIRSGTCTASTALAAGQSCTVAYAFKPTAKNSRTASLAIVTASGTVNLALSGTGK